MTFASLSRDLARADAASRASTSRTPIPPRIAAVRHAAPFVLGGLAFLTIVAAVIALRVAIYVPGLWH